MWHNQLSALSIPYVGYGSCYCAKGRRGAANIWRYPKGNATLLANHHQGNEITETKIWHGQNQWFSCRIVSVKRSTLHIFSKSYLILSLSCVEHPEPHRYKPFVFATNTALGWLKDVQIGQAGEVKTDPNDMLYFMRHDPRPIHSVHPGVIIKTSKNENHRKPDVICASKKHMAPLYDSNTSQGKPVSTKELLALAVDPPARPLEWTYHHACFEMKLVTFPLKYENTTYNDKYTKLPLTEYDYRSKQEKVLETSK